MGPIIGFSGPEMDLLGWYFPADVSGNVKITPQLRG